VDELGRIVDGDRMIYICAKMLKVNNQLPGDMVTATVMSNIGFHRAIGSIGCRVETTQVGDRYVLESMLKTGCVIGGEQSGHIIFLNHTTTGDGILSALQLIGRLRSREKAVGLADEVTIYPQVMKNARVKNENKKSIWPTGDRAEIKRLEEIMAGEGRVLIRPSGTEPLVRVMIEGKASARSQSWRKTWLHC
jgi:phosphoglucosamine mutase